MADNLISTTPEDREQALQRAMANIASGEPASAMRERMEKASMELDKALAILDLAEGNTALDPAGEFDAIFEVIGDLVRKGKEVLDHATSEALRAEARTQLDAWRHSCSVENGGARA